MTTEGSRMWTIDPNEVSEFTKEGITVEEAQ